MEKVLKQRDEEWKSRWEQREQELSAKLKAREDALFFQQLKRESELFKTMKEREDAMEKNMLHKASLWVSVQGTLEGNQSFNWKEGQRIEEHPEL